MVIEAEFIVSSAKISQLPKTKLAEYAFIGRSNVGKSSLINMLTGRKKLAKISVTPGKTQLINHFLINNQWYLVDLPGYGFAKVSQSMRKKWEKLIEEYLTKRLQLACTFILVDVRVPPQQIDIEFINWMGKNHLPFQIIFTKADKINSATTSKNIAGFKQKLLEFWEELPVFYLSSAKTRQGREEILTGITSMNESLPNL